MSHLNVDVVKKAGQEWERGGVYDAIFGVQDHQGSLDGEQGMVACVARARAKVWL